MLVRPLINRKLEEKDCGEGPNLEIIFEDDVHLNNIQEKIIVSIIIKLYVDVDCIPYTHTSMTVMCPSHLSYHLVGLFEQSICLSR